ncbi:MAG: response regulator [Halobacteriovoraceae bacterium]|nr:response regulator [Halobacteriovoraceae bacterium]
MSKSILIIEDQGDLIEIYSKFAQELFTSIDSASTIEDSLNVLNKKLYDCILLDINLNNTENGAQVLKYLMDNPTNQNAQTPVVISSAYVNSIFIEKFQGRFAGILKKPYDQNTFLSTVKMSTLSVEDVLFNPDQEDEVPIVKTDTPFSQPELQNKVKSIINNIAKNPEIKSLLKKIKVDRNKDKYVGAHAGLLINISTAISKELHWDSRSTLEKFVTASYIHDYALSNRPDLARIQTQAELEAKSTSLSDKEIEAVRQHPLLSSQIFESFSNIPQDVHTIIQQHHERPDGSGFPGGISHNRISPMAALFIISHDFCLYIIENPKWKLDNYIIHAKHKFKGPNFNKIMRALSSIGK